MIRVTIEMLPHGNEKRKYLLGSMTIFNDTTGDGARGNYAARAYDRRGRVWKVAQVFRFPRKRLLVWDLLYRVLGEMVGERNP